MKTVPLDWRLNNLVCHTNQGYTVEMKYYIQMIYNFNSNLNCLFATLTRPVTRYKTQQTSKHKQSLNVCSQLPTNYSSLSTTYFYAVLNQFLYHKLGIMTFLLKLRQGVTNFKKIDHLYFVDWNVFPILYSLWVKVDKQSLLII